MDSRQIDGRQVDGRQIDGRQIDGRQIDGRQLESRQVDSRQSESRQSDHRSSDLKAAKTEALKRGHYRSKSSLKQTRLENIGGIGPEGIQEMKQHRHSAHVEGRHAGAFTPQEGGEEGIGRDGKESRGRGFVEEEHKAREYRNEYKNSFSSSSSTLQHNPSQHSHKYSTNTLQFHREMLTRPGSPIWKPRSIVRNNGGDDEYASTTTAASVAPATKQRVAFAIPDKKYDAVDTDC